MATVQPLPSIPVLYGSTTTTEHLDSCEALESADYQYDNSSESEGEEVLSPVISYDQSDESQTMPTDDIPNVETATGVPLPAAEPDNPVILLVLPKETELNDEASRMIKFEPHCKFTPLTFNPVDKKARAADNNKQAVMNATEDTKDPQQRGGLSAQYAG
ncbi:hypothetical protein SARC_09485 [Sphaeroforma arctica JP610]|uniref:Uncharacterized protein n=1 Tax=Sphaeroforma arctica JP610 TaxID=667725 RepID=A0A0L0FMU2_9EUKA|nr:hypothetical protein SARC_09485 [Sphaeroforma arctica JP610]KNC78064.1 hypothetical protein SARC_09485 [Sphaeroforma arctica JP610]|eukprot:XP_014151966.1 hypothetical protein SARC_09485 [Sphaeroforma arctica JP610]